MDKIELGKKLVAYVKRNDWVSFVDVEDQLQEQGVILGGDFSYQLADKNIVFWEGMSLEMLEVIESLLESKELFLHPAEQVNAISLLLYGGRLRLPVARRVPRTGYRKPHWLPAYFRTVPLESNKG